MWPADPNSMRVRHSILFLVVHVGAPATHSVIPDFHGDHRADPGEGANEDPQQGAIPEVSDGYRAGLDDRFGKPDSGRQPVRDRTFRVKTGCYV